MNKTGTKASVAAFISKAVRQQLYDLGYKKADVDKMKPDQAHAILNGKQAANAVSSLTAADFENFAPTFDSDTPNVDPPRSPKTGRADTPILPRDSETERFVLGALLLSESAEQIREMAANLPSDAFMAGNREIYATLCEMAEQGDSINTVVLHRRLIERGSKVDLVTITALYDGVPRFSNSSLATEIKILRDLATQRAILRDAWNWHMQAQGHNVDVDALVERIKSAAAKFGAADVKQTKRIAISWGEACEMEFPLQENILNGIERGEVVNCSAITDRGKSTLWRNIAISIACGREFPPVVRAGKSRRVLYTDFETRWRKLRPGITTMLGRLTQAERAMISDNLHTIADCRINNWPLSLSLNPHWNILESEIQRLRPDVVIIDTLTTAFDIQNENDNSEASRTMKKLSALAEKWDCVVVFLHHIGKLKQEEGGTAQSVYRSRGGSAYSGCAHAIINLLPDKDSKDRFTLECPKLKGEHFENTVFDINKETRWCVAAGVAEKAPSTYEQVVGIFNGRPLKMKEIKSMLPNLSGRTVEDTLKAALKVGDLLQPSRGVYQKPGQNPVSTDSTAPIGDVGNVESAQPVDGIEDSLNFEEWDEKGECGNEPGDLWDSEPDEDRYLDAIAE
jgi:hypothetical protein